MTTDQPRTPAGSPAGGQFGEKPCGAEGALALPAADAVPQHRWSDDERVLLAIREDTDAATLTALVKDPATSDDARRAVARREDASDEALSHLASASDVWTREKVAENRSATAPVLDLLARDESWAVREAVVMNPNTPQSALDHLAATEGDTLARFALAARSDLSRTAFEQLAKAQGDWGVAEAVAQNRAVPADIAAKLAGHPKWQVRYAAASNPQTPADVRKKLESDPNERVALHALGWRLGKEQEAGR